MTAFKSIIHALHEKFIAMLATDGYCYAISVSFAAFAIVAAKYAINALLIMLVWNFIANIFSLPTITYLFSLAIFTVYAIINRVIYFSKKDLAGR